MKFKHAGIEIELVANGQFAAVIAGKTVRKPSLDAMKKHIDTLAKTTFEPFEALARMDAYGVTKADKDGFGKIKIIGRKKTSAWRYRTHEWDFVIDNYGRTAARVMVDSPENRKAVQTYDAHREETSRIRSEHETEERKLAAAIKYHVADDHK